MAAEFFLHKGSPTYLHPENAADVMSISQFMAQNLRQPPPIPPPPPKHTFEISEGESVEIEKIVAAEKKDGQLYYKVKWVKYTWEAEESIQHLPHLIDGYWREHFYQNINQAAIDTSIGLVNENDYTRNKSVVVNTTDAQKQVPVASTAALIGEKIVITAENRAGVTSATVPGVEEHNDVIMEFTMPGSKTLEGAYQNMEAPTVATAPVAKKPRRAYPLERKYGCNVCNKAFDRNTSLTRHLLTHTREKPFKCQLCEKAFSQNAHLKRHILIHIGQKSYQCNKCGKMFIEKGGLARHEATHSTEKPWVCNQCGKAFVLNEYLQRHLFLHTGQKPYQCNDCGRLFADGSSWRAHKLTHNKEKKYKCHICSKMLKCKRNFKKHVAAHEEDKELKHICDICDQRFPNKKLLRQHTKRSRRNHRCVICRKPLKTRDKFIVHMATHDPNSDTYNPNPIKLDPEEDDEEEEEKEEEEDEEKEGEKSDDEEEDSQMEESKEEDAHEKSVAGFTALIIKPDREVTSTPMAVTSEASTTVNLPPALSDNLIVTSVNICSTDAAELEAALSVQQSGEVAPVQIASLASSLCNVEPQLQNIESAVEIESSDNALPEISMVDSTQVIAVLSQQIVRSEANEPLVSASDVTSVPTQSDNIHAGVIMTAEETAGVAETIIMMTEGSGVDISTNMIS